MPGRHAPGSLQSPGRQIHRLLEGQMTLGDLAAWAEEVFRDLPFERVGAEQLGAVLSIIRALTSAPASRRRRMYSRWSMSAIGTG